MDILRIYIDANANLQLMLNKWIIIVGIIIFLIWFIYKLYQSLYNGIFEIDEVQLGIGKQTIKIRPNYKDKQIAYKLWVELSTRKIGLPINFENDVIDEIYNSWYEFFKLTRELIKNIPINKIQRNQSTEILVNVAIDVLNEGLRPHLTLWQAKFRKWYRLQCHNVQNNNLYPQDLQKNFPEYKKLINDMKEVNYKLIYYREILKKIAFS